MLEFGDYHNMDRTMWIGAHFDFKYISSNSLFSTKRCHLCFADIDFSVGF